MHARAVGLGRVQLVELRALALVRLAEALFAGIAVQPARASGGERVAKTAKTRRPRATR